MPTSQLTISSTRQLAGFCRRWAAKRQEAISFAERSTTSSLTVKLPACQAVAGQGWDDRDLSEGNTQAGRLSVWALFAAELPILAWIFAAVIVLHYAFSYDRIVWLMKN
jgi:hypothetical protein